jgi:DNA-binding HxlR family transcriptional regulator
MVAVWVIGSTPVYAGRSFAERIRLGKYAVFSYLVSERIPRLMSDACLDPADCPVERTLGVIGGRWKPLILFHLRRGQRRFNELRRLMPKVTQRMLTQHLRELEADGIVSRTVHHVVPPRVDYDLTELGRTLLPVLDAMAAWGDGPEIRRPGANLSAPIPDSVGAAAWPAKRPQRPPAPSSAGTEDRAVS